MRTSKKLVVAGALGLAVLGAGCADFSEREYERPNDDAIQSESRELGREAGKATREVGEKVQEAVEGFREGIGGSGDADGEVDVQPGSEPGVINDGEGPLEERSTEPVEAP